MNRLIAVLAALVLAPAALAQDATQPATPPAEQAATAPAGPDLAALEGKIASLEEQVLETKGTVAALSKLKFSGYIQARWAYNEAGTATSTSSPPFEYNTTPESAPAANGFFIRRGRFKAVYTGDHTDFVLQIDAIPQGVTIKEGYGTLKLPAGWAIDAGLQLLPFGYEVAGRSSSDLDLLERALVTSAFLAGEYDVGVSVRGRLFDVVNLRLGLFNGNGVVSGQDGKDNDQLKDVIGRATVDFGMITGGLSGWYGKTINYARADDKKYDRYRVGADLQVYLDLLPFGGTALKGEYIWGRTTIGTAGSGATANGGAGRNLPGLTSDAPVPTGSGWYALVTQNVAKPFQLAARYEQYMPDHTVDTETGSTVKEVREVQLALHTFVGEGGKVSVLWAHPMYGEKGPDAADDPNLDRLIVQVQAKF